MTPLQRLLRKYARHSDATYASIALAADASPMSVQHVLCGRRGKGVLGIHSGRGERRPIIFRVANALGIPNVQLRRALIDTWTEELDSIFSQYAYGPVEREEAE